MNFPHPNCKEVHLFYFNLMPSQLNLHDHLFHIYDFLFILLSINGLHLLIKKYSLNHFYLINIFQHFLLLLLILMHFYYYKQVQINENLLSYVNEDHKIYYNYIFIQNYQIMALLLISIFLLYQM